MRVFINTIPYYGKGEGVRTYTSGLLRALHASSAEMEWQVVLHPQDFEKLGLNTDPRFRLWPCYPRSSAGLRFVWRNGIDQVVVPVHAARCEIVHYLDSYGPLVSPLTLHSAQGATRVVLTVHDLIPLVNTAYHTSWVRRYLATLMRASIPHAAALFADSQTTASDLVTRLRIPAERISVVPMGVDNRFRPATVEERRRVMATYELTAPYILTVGTIEPRKNLARVVRAFAQARRRYQLPHQLLIVGKPGWGYQDLQRAIAEAQMGSAVRLMGYLPAEDIAPLISQADLLVYLSLEEGFGLPVAEGMACGAPVLTSSVSSVAEVAGEAAATVDPLNVEEIAQTLATLCRDHVQRDHLAQAGLVRAREYTWERVAAATLTTYTRLMTPLPAHEAG